MLGHWTVLDFRGVLLVHIVHSLKSKRHKTRDASMFVKQLIEADLLLRLEIVAG